MKFKPLTVAVAIIALAALAGCTDSSSPSTGSGENPGSTDTTGGGGVDPCSLITTSEATAVLGTPANDGTTTVANEAPARL